MIENEADPSEDFISQIKSSNVLSAQRALEIYQEDYRARLKEALKNTYRCIYSLIGDHDFQLLSSEYIKVHHSTSKDLDDYGEQFEFFCSQNALVCEYPFLSEMAQFEWQFRLLFHQQFTEGANQESLQQCMIRDEKIKLVNSAHLLSFNFLISELYAIKDIDCPTPFDFKKKEWLLLYKDHDTVMKKSLSKSQWEFLKILNENQSLTSSLELHKDHLNTTETTELFAFIASSKILAIS